MRRQRQRRRWCCWCCRLGFVCVCARDKLPRNSHFMRIHLLYVLSSQTLPKCLLFLGLRFSSYSQSHSHSLCCFKIHKAHGTGPVSLVQRLYIFIYIYMCAPRCILFFFFLSSLIFPSSLSFAPIVRVTSNTTLHTTWICKSKYKRWSAAEIYVCAAMMRMVSCTIRPYDLYYYDNVRFLVSPGCFSHHKSQMLVFRIWHSISLIACYFVCI